MSALSLGSEHRGWLMCPHGVWVLLGVGGGCVTRLWECWEPADEASARFAQGHLLGEGTEGCVGGVLGSRQALG